MEYWQLQETVHFDAKLFSSESQTLKICEVDWILTTCNDRCDSIKYLEVKCKENNGMYLVRLIEMREYDSYNSKIITFQYYKFYEHYRKIRFHIKDADYQIQFFCPKRAVTGEQQTSNDQHGKVNVPITQTKTPDTVKKTDEREHEREVIRDLSSLWQKGILSDVDIRCGSEVFKAHKAILAARSTFFAAMFQTPMKESRENVVVVKDIRPEILKNVLSYIYSGKIEDLRDSEVACEVMCAADLYNIPSLKKISSNFLKSALSVSNAVSLLVFSDLRDPDLKTEAVRFICDNFDSLKATEEWEQLQKQNPNLVIAVMTEKIHKLSASK